MSEQTIILESKNGVQFEVPREVAMMMVTIANLVSVEDDGNDNMKDSKANDVVKVEPVESNILEMVIKFCRYHVDSRDKSAEDLAIWDANFIKAANYLDLKPLLELTCKTIADYIKACKTPQEIRRRFNIKNDFTPEEEEQVRKENAWCEEA